MIHNIRNISNKNDSYQNDKKYNNISPTTMTLIMMNNKKLSTTQNSWMPVCESHFVKTLSTYMTHKNDTQQNDA